MEQNKNQNRGRVGLRRSLGLGAVILLLGSATVHRLADAATGTVEQSMAAVRAASHVDPVAASGAGVDVAVIDTGVVPTRFLQGDRLIYGPDFSADALKPSLQDLDAFGHGTNVASIVAGMASAARVVSVKVAAADGSTTPARLAAAVGWVALNAHTGGRNIRVLNFSYGIPPGPEGTALIVALRAAWAAGIVVVASAGNDGVGFTIDAPASDSWFVAVGAAKAGGTNVVPADFSSSTYVSRSVDVIALGVDIVGARVPGSFLDQMFPEARSGDDGFRGSGTSQASAVVSGIAAGLIGRAPRLTADQVKALLRDSARFVFGYTPAVQGRGVVDQQTALARSAPVAWWASVLNGTLVPLPPLPSLGELVKPLDGSAWNGPEWSGNRWSGGAWQGNRWSGNRWSGSRWE